MSHNAGQDNHVDENEIEESEEHQCSRQNSIHHESVKLDEKVKESLIQGVECSVRSTEGFTVRFVNTTDKSVDVIWLDFDGQPVTYTTLQPQTAWSVYTYKV